MSLCLQNHKVLPIGQIHHQARGRLTCNRPVAVTAVPDRRTCLLSVFSVPLVLPVKDKTAIASEIIISPAVVKLELAPDQSKYDPGDAKLRQALEMLQQGLNAGDVQLEEATWTKIINQYSSVDAPWVPDVVGRAYGNRGNARSRQGRLEEALLDYNKAMEICPWSVDPVLNRGVALEALGRFEEAVSDYRAVLAAEPEDPAAWNNLGNATAGLGSWEEAAGYFRKATLIAPGFSFAAANYALAMYQIGKRNEAVKAFRSLLRKYPEFADVRAALAAALWADGLEDQAENAWSRVEDIRYKDRKWLRTNRRWPPKLADALEAFLDVKSVAQSS
ncbi:hypothetical protein CEUSTIGMA_g8351.t1 [Chlamydomonas eustigma]|uniref:Uncharacterized protein n=1 Tax=Chlamydomonas eustigma TaxID=1157962 RepID=A0A250XCZ7_9CHLO|nr:hypothetical protein CEUSTIGMA_g8351.t1 [Chlamydomonas eustigma]|eukprot:GAX80916.1 hypothetical protein CEUSTIGMA_g8351.t1 [Chlamydomonas eustigma]